MLHGRQAFGQSAVSLARLTWAFSVCMMRLYATECRLLTGSALLVGQRLQHVLPAAALERAGHGAPRLARGLRLRLRRDQQRCGAAGAHHIHGRQVPGAALRGAL